MIIPSIDHILPHLLALFSVKKLSHAYILDGLPLSMHLSTSDQLHGQIMAQGYTDIHSPEIEEGKSIKVDDVREIINKLSVKPKSSCHWIILPYAELMNQSAANALLKILEEPPGSCCFLMLSIGLLISCKLSDLGPKSFYYVQLCVLARMKDIIACVLRS